MRLCYLNFYAKYIWTKKLCYMLNISHAFIVFYCCLISADHQSDVIMGATASQITSLTIVYSTVYPDADQRKKIKSSASLAFVRGLQRALVNSPHKGPVTRKMVSFDDVIMHTHILQDHFTDFCHEWGDIYITSLYKHEKTMQTKTMCIYHVL